MFNTRYRQLKSQVPTGMNTRARAESQPLLMTIYAERRDDSVFQIVLQTPRCPRASQVPAYQRSI